MKNPMRKCYSILFSDLFARNWLILTAFILALFSSGCKDPCDEVYCQNGGTCDEGVCDCPEGYSGPHCEDFILQPPEVGFSTTPSNKIIADQTNVEFYPNSTSPLTIYFWNFGQNESSSTSSYPHYKFEFEGNKQVTFTGSNQAGSDTESKIIKVHAMDPDCHNYGTLINSKGAILLVRNNNALVVGKLRIQNNYNEPVDIHLYHPDEWLAGKYKPFANSYWNVSSNSGNWTTLNFSGGNINIGNDWGIRVRFSNGVISCIRNIHQIATYNGGYYYVKATDIYEG